jgi:hypothetical protein
MITAQAVNYNPLFLCDPVLLVCCSFVESWDVSERPCDDALLLCAFATRTRGCFVLLWFTVGGDGRKEKVFLLVVSCACGLALLLHHGIWVTRGCQFGHGRLPGPCVMFSSVFSVWASRGASPSVCDGLFTLLVNCTRLACCPAARHSTTGAPWLCSWLNFNPVWILGSKTPLPSTIFMHLSWQCRAQGLTSPWINKLLDAGLDVVIILLLESTPLLLSGGYWF